MTGKDVTLDCSIGDTSLKDNTGVYWTRDGLEWPDYIMFYRGRLDNHNQVLRYQNRVQLADPGLKDNNFSLILQNVTKNDSGTYECNLKVGFDVRTINTIKLSVTEQEMDHDPEKKNLWLVVGLPVTAAVFLVVAAVALWRFHVQTVAGFVRK